MTDGAGKLDTALETGTARGFATALFAATELFTKIPGLAMDLTANSGSTGADETITAAGPGPVGF